MIQHTRVAAESNKSWKRCSSHVYITRLIRVLQISDRKEEWPIPPTSFQNVLCPLPLYGYSSSSPVKAINTTLALNRRRNLPFGFILSLTITFTWKDLVFLFLQMHKLSIVLYFYMVINFQQTNVLLLNYAV